MTEQDAPLNSRGQLKELLSENAEWVNWIIREGLESTIDMCVRAVPIPMARGALQRAMYGFVLRECSELVGEPLTIDDVWRMAPFFLDQLTDEQINQALVIALGGATTPQLIEELRLRGMIADPPKGLLSSG